MTLLPGSPILDVLNPSAAIKALAETTSALQSLPLTEPLASPEAVDGSLHGLHATADLEQGEWIGEYLEQVRGIERHDPLRARLTELTDRGRRFDALRLVRASAPDLSVQEARDYVEAVATRMSVPEHIHSLLPRTRTGRRVCWRLSGPNPEPGTCIP